MQAPESRVTTVAEESSKIFISAAVKRILSFWDVSSKVLTAPHPFDFPKGSIDSIKMSKAAGAFRKANREGEMMLVTQHANFPEDKLYIVGYTKPLGEQGGELVIATFPSDFKARCKKQRKDEFEVVEQAMVDLIFKDIEAASLGKKRASVKQNLAIKIKLDDN